VACVAVPADVEVRPERRMRLRGVDVFVYEFGSRAELVTGTTTITLFADPEHLEDAIRALRPIGFAPAPRLNDHLPPPAPGALAGKLRC
jgi:hypothetical protein